MKKIMFVALALLMGLASCVKDKQYPGITISNVSYTPTAVQAETPVTVTATITSFKEILEGKHDELPEAAFYMVGGIDEVIEKAKKLKAEEA